jgi:hypothetical protein
METKHCTKCGIEKNIIQFSKRSDASNRYQSWCKNCNNILSSERTKRLWKEKPEEMRQQSRIYRSTPIGKEVTRKSGKKRRVKLRADVLAGYGGTHPKCACCGENEKQFLAIDHIEGRKGIPRELGYMFYLRLRKEGFPDGYQILCHNCNMAKGMYGQCPHRAQATYKKPNN